MRLHALTVLTCAASLVAAAPAAADSLVFVRANNVWLANADGSGQYQVTLDGTAGSPYESASQADDGTILAIRQPPGGRNQFWRMSQSGRLLNAPANTPAPGPAGALDARISPDGRLVAYWFVTTVSDPYCPYCVNVSNRALLAIRIASRTPTRWVRRTPGAGRRGSRTTRSRWGAAVPRSGTTSSGCRRPRSGSRSPT